MASNFPSTLTTYTNPNPTDKLNAPSHAAIEQNQNSGLTQVEAVIGTASSIIGTITGDLRNPNSGGGGHIQLPQTGGTGQTFYNKGDILVGSSSSVLSKVTIGTDGLALVADSSKSAGVSWGQVIAALPYAQDGGTGSVYSIAPVPCILSYAAGQVYVAKITNTNTVISPALSVSSLLAKKIVNSNGSSVLVGQIKSSTISIFGYDGSASVMQLLTSPPAIYNNGLSSHSNGTGTQTIAHGLGVIPKYIRITWEHSISTSAGGIMTGTGVYNGATVSQIFTTLDGSNNWQQSTDGANIITVNTGGTNNGHTAVPTFDATNITLTWTITNSPTTTNFVWEAYA